MCPDWLRVSVFQIVDAAAEGAQELTYLGGTCTGEELRHEPG